VRPDVVCGGAFQWKDVTSIARLDGKVDGSCLAQLLDVEQNLRDVLPASEPDITEATVGHVNIARGANILAADDSGVARSMIEQSLTAMGLPSIMARMGLEAWNMLEAAKKRAHASRHAVSDEIALV
jgi:two-component system chemotaxis response regulator CheV